jgi:hypothetical protein
MFILLDKEIFCENKTDFLHPKASINQDIHNSHLFILITLKLLGN